MKLMNEYEVDDNDIENISPGRGNIITISKEGEHIAEYYFDCMPTQEDDIYTLIPHLFNVEEKYRRKGISTELIRVLKGLGHSIHFINVKMAIDLCIDQFAELDLYLSKLKKKEAKEESFIKRQFLTDDFQEKAIAQLRSIRACECFAVNKIS